MVTKLDVYSNPSTGQIDLDSEVKETSDSHSTITDPNLRDFAGKENLLSYSEDFSNAFWAKQACSQVPNSGTDPNGGNTATKIVPDSTGTSLCYSRSSRHELAVQKAKG